MASDDRAADEADDPLLAGLIGRAREARAADDRWRALAEGEATADEARALAAEDPERYARHRPFDDVEDEALLAGALDALAGGDGGQRENSDPLVDRAPPIDPGALAAPVAAVIRPARWRRVVYIVTPLALAAGLALILLRPGPSPTLPAYRLDDNSGDRVTRSEGAARVVHPDARLRWVLRPAHPVQPTVDARAFVIDHDQITTIQTAFDRAPGGALRLDAPIAQALPGRTGPVSLLIVIGPEQDLLRLDANPAAFDPRDPPSVFRVLKHRVDIRPEPD